MNRDEFARAAGIALALTIAPAVAFDTARIEDPDVRACADRALPTESASQIQKVEVIGANGYVRESRRLIYWKRTPDNESRILVRVLEPIDDKGVAVLINDDGEKDVLTYMTYSPKLKRVRRVTGESFFGSVLGTDFTYEDFSYFYRVDEREEVVRVEDAVVDGHPAYVMETVNQSENSHYSLLRFYIDKDVCLPVRTDFLATNGELRKQLLIDRAEIREVGDHWVPYRTTMTDLKHATRTVFVVEEVEIDPELWDNMFDVAELKRGGH